MESGVTLQGVIYSESEESQFPNIDYNYISKDESEPNMLDNDLNSKIKEAIDSAFRTMANKNNNEIKDIIEKTLKRKLDLLEKNVNTKIKEAIANDRAIRQTSVIQTIANLTKVVQTLSLKLAKLENCTAVQNNYKINETNSEVDTSDSRLLTITVPSSVRARSEVWERDQVPLEDDLDKFMTNATGCEYMARLPSSYQSVSNSTAHGGRWQRRLAVRGENWARIRVTWNAGHDYYFLVGDTETRVIDYIQATQLLYRATPGVMSMERYTLFYYIQLEDGVMSFGTLNESTPWLRHSVTVSARDVVHMEYNTGSQYGVKLLVCE